MTDRVHLVLDSNRHVLDVYTDRDLADTFANQVGAWVETWPIRTKARA